MPETHHAPDAPTRSESYLVRHWRGDLPLGRALWINGIMALSVPALLSILVSAPPMALREQPGAVRVLACVWFVAIALRLVLQLWWNIGIWHSANFHVQRGGQRLWVVLAKLFVLAAATLQIGGLVFIAGSPHIVVLQIMLGQDPHGHAKLQVSPDRQSLRISGEIGTGFAAELAQVLHDTAGVSTLQLSSNGGRMYEAIAAAKQIRALGLDTHVADQCNSGCTLLFLAGRNRTIGSNASLGFHKPVLGTLDGSESDSEVQLSAMKNLGAPEAFLARIRALTDRRAWYPTAHELFELKVITAPAIQAPYCSSCAQ
jgi:hypothetical protein